MPILTAARIAQIRQRAWAIEDAALTDHVDYWPVVKASIGGKDSRDTWPAKSGSPLICAVLDREASIVGDTFIDTPAATPSHTVVLSRSATSPKPADRLYWTERAIWLEVMPSQNPGTYGPARRVECIEIKP